GDEVPLPGLPTMTVAETGSAAAIAAEGSLPFRLTPDVPHRYADLYGPDGEFATLEVDAAGAATLYAGREMTLADLGLDEQAQAKLAAKPAKAVAAVELSCPNCAGPLTLRAPDDAQRVVCPSCKSLLDVTEGRLDYLTTINVEQSMAAPPLIAVGAEGELRGTKWTVVGYCRRTILLEGVDYPWDEYLLYAVGEGFAWLVHSDRHWNIAKVVPTGAVKEKPKAAVRKGVTFKLFQKGSATVRYVLGEFYWKVQIGESVETADYVAPPLSLSKEESTAFDAATSSMVQEVNWTLAEYLPIEEVEVAFQVKAPRPFGVAPNQPPYDFTQV
ncbi:MAG: DUF4178 domain-containing protein, partial [Planctomycetia bacterium]